MEKGNTLSVADRNAWRGWLQKHHETESEVWLIFFKKHTSNRGITYIEALEEALCFGWIDSIVRRVDDEKYAQKFTPRRDKSKWSELNKQRVRKLAKEGKMTPAGLARISFSLTNLEGSSTQVKEEVILSENLSKILKEHPAAWQNFNMLPPSHRRNYIGWIMSAKREETRQKRLMEAIELLAQGKRLGLK